MMSIYLLLTLFQFAPIGDKSADRVKECSSSECNLSSVDAYVKNLNLLSMLGSLIHVVELVVPMHPVSVATPHSAVTPTLNHYANHYVVLYHLIVVDNMLIRVYPL